MCVRVREYLASHALSELGVVSPRPADDDDDALQVHHERRRTYYLRPLKRDELRGDPMAEKALWIQAINTAISGISHPFASKFRTRK